MLRSTFSARLFAAAIASFLVPATCSKVHAGRWAILAGNNEGLAEQQPLRWAERDARRLSTVLAEVGGFRPENIRLLLGRSPRELLQAVEQVSRLMLQNSGGHALLLVYYSGHSDGRSLLMNGQRLELKQLKKTLSTIPVGVKLLVLDACKAGAAVLDRGGVSVPAFVRLEQLPRAQGTVVLASASSSEPAQESDEIAGSYFTHAMLSGLRGEADASGDGRVTLEELYRYVYDQTLERTIGTLAGTQHPVFEYDMQGEGSIVLADLNAGPSALVITSGKEGTYLLVDKQRGMVVAEIEKKAGDAKMVRLAPGRYLVKKRERGAILSGSVEIGEGQQVLLDESKMRRRALRPGEERGWAVHEDLPAEVGYAVELAGRFDSFSLPPAGGVWSVLMGGVALVADNLPWNRWRVRGALLAGGAAHRTFVEQVSLGFTLRAVGVEIGLGRVFRYGPLWSDLAGQVAVSWLQRNFDTEPFGGSDQTVGFGPSLSAGTGVWWKGWSAGIRAAAGVEFFPWAERKTVPVLSLAIVVSAKL